MLCGAFCKVAHIECVAFILYVCLVFFAFVLKSIYNSTQDAEYVQIPGGLFDATVRGFLCNRLCVSGFYIMCLSDVFFVFVLVAVYSGRQKATTKGTYMNV